MLVKAQVCWPVVLPLSRLCDIVIYSINLSFLIGRRGLTFNMGRHYLRVVLKLKKM